jgi:hypothetical protein
MATHTHLCKRCPAQWRCTRDDCTLLYQLCTPCDERTYGQAHAAADALDAALRAGALVRCAACGRLHAEGALHAGITTHTERRTYGTR